jgi:hypothetical protein
MKRLEIFSVFSKIFLMPKAEGMCKCPPCLGAAVLCGPTYPKNTLVLGAGDKPPAALLRPPPAAEVLIKHHERGRGQAFQGGCRGGFHIRSVRRGAQRSPAVTNPRCVEAVINRPRFFPLGGIPATPCVGAAVLCGPTYSKCATPRAGGSRFPTQGHLFVYESAYTLQNQRCML